MKFCCRYTHPNRHNKRLQPNIIEELGDEMVDDLYDKLRLSFFSWMNTLA
jgi:hypothetical protein